MTDDLGQNSIIYFIFSVKWRCTRELGGATQTGVTSISNVSGDITLAPAIGAGAVQINSGAASISSITGALVVTGGVGVSGAINAGSSIYSAGNITSLGQITSSSNSTASNAISWNSGNSVTTSYDCASQIDFSNLRNGGEYTLVVTGTGATRCDFNTTVTGTDASVFYLDAFDG